MALLLLAAVPLSHSAAVKPPVSMGRTLYKTGFDGDQIAHAPWTINHGKWTIAEGSLRETTIPAKKHAANLSLMADLPETFIFSIDLHLGESGETSISFAGSGQGCKLIVNIHEMYFRTKAGKSGSASIIDWRTFDLDKSERHHLDFIRHG